MKSNQRSITAETSIIEARKKYWVSPIIPDKPLEFGGASKPELAWGGFNNGSSPQGNAETVVDQEIAANDHSDEGWSD